MACRPFETAARQSRITSMKDSSQERKTGFDRLRGRRCQLTFEFLCSRLNSVTGLFVVVVFLMLCTAGGASADKYDDLMTQDDRSGQKSDPSLDPQSRIDYRAQEERELRALRRLRQKAEIKERELQDDDSLYDRFDGSEFKKKTFIDTDFRKESYTDLSTANSRRDTRPDDEAVRAKDLFGKTADERSREYYAKEKEKRDLREHDRDRNVWLHLTKPIPDMLNDWVPSKADPIHNGAFEREPDNGTPVPYHLNGHPDFQRKLPWAD